MRKLRQSEKVREIAKIGLFSELTTKELGFVSRQVTQMTFHEGNVLATEGEVGREAMIIVDGTAVVHRNGHEVATLGPGDVMGEMSLVTEAPRNATVSATSELTVLLMNSREFSAVLSANPTVTEKLLRTVAARVAENERGVV